MASSNHANGAIDQVFDAITSTLSLLQYMQQHLRKTQALPVYCSSYYEQRFWP